VVARASRPRYTWRMFQTGLSNLGEGASLTFVLNTVGAAPNLGSGLGVFGDYTVRRVVGTLSVMSNNVADVAVMDQFAWGIYIAEKDAVLAGGTPEPLSDPADWFGFGTGAVSLASAGGVAATYPMLVYAVDTRAMRKVNENHQDVVFRIEAPAANVADVLLVLTGRLLVSHGQR